MAEIDVVTSINAPLDRCFDIARSIDFHVVSTANTGERAIAGRTTGLIEADDIVTFSARHLGFRWKLTSRIIEFDPPHKFTDQMLKGPFKELRHEHIFEEKNGITIMTDSMMMTSPFGFIGKAFDNLILESYMEKFLKLRCYAVKDCLESEDWKKYLTA